VHLGVLGPVGRAERAVGVTVLRVLGVLLVATAVLVLVAPRDPDVVFRRPLVLAGFVVAGLLAALTVTLATRSRPRWLPRRGHGWWSWGVAVTIAVAGAAAGFALARRLAYVVGWDAGVMADFSARLHASGTLSPYAVDYLSRYPGNVPLLAILDASQALAERFGTTMAEVFVAFNALCVGVGLLATYAVVRMVRTHRAGVCAQLVLLLLLVASPWLAVPYTDVVLVPFLAVGLLLAVAAVRARRVRTLVSLGLASVVVLSLGLTVKATVAAALVAVALTAVLVVVSRHDRRSLVVVVALVAAGCAAFLGTTTIAHAAAQRVSRVDSARLAPDRAPPLSWWVAMGLTTTRTSDGRAYYGSYSGAMVDESMHLRGAQLRAYSREALGTRVSELGPAGLAGFAVDKQAFNWGDGMFFAWGEGHDADPRRLLAHDATARWVQSWNHVSGRDYLARASLTTGVWLFVLAWAGVGLLGAGYRREVVVLALTVLVLVGLTLLLQSRSRYLFAYLPVVVALAATVDARDLVRARRRRPGAGTPTAHHEPAPDGGAVDTPSLPR
jgi:4-amino-4-deoxy-L-arabinose transferase-like glycosyltransferase